MNRGQGPVFIATKPSASPGLNWSVMVEGAWATSVAASSFVITTSFGTVQQSPDF